MYYIAKIFVVLSLPLFVAWIRSAPRNRLYAYALMGALPLTLNALKLEFSPISWAAWPGYVKGLTFTALDTLAIAIIITHRRPRRLPPFTGVLIAYLLAAMLSVAFSNVMMGSAFYSFQLLRVIVVFYAVAMIAANPQAIRYLAIGLAAGIAFQAGHTIWQRAGGVFQASGTMGHQNLLGLMTHFITLPLLAMLLGGVRSRMLVLGVVSGLLVIALGASRGAIGFGTLGVGMVMLASLIRRPAPHKWRIVGLGAVALLAVSPLMYSALNKRFALLEENGGYDERAAFERAATMMWTDHPMGVGANQYVVVANTKGYSARAGVVWTWGSRSANVHNTRLLVAAETGWAGLIAYVALFAAVIFAGIRFVFGDRRDPRGDIVLGCTTAVAVTAIHNFYEWVWVTYQAQYVFAISLGIIAAMIRAREAEQAAARRARAAARSQPATQPEPALAAVSAPRRPGQGTTAPA